MMSDIFRAYHEAVVYGANFCWYPRIPDYGYKRVKRSE
jgi:hypothetical protein